LVLLHPTSDLSIIITFPLTDALSAPPAQSASACAASVEFEDA
jgi:hypothetical protein